MKPVVIISHGEYSDYSVIGIVEWVGACTPQEARDMFVQECPREDDNYRIDPFVAWLLRRGIIREMSHQELWLGLWTSLEEEIQFRPRPGPLSTSLETEEE